jgi:CheY-like chemotaxis protein
MRRVLAVDDDPSILAVIKDILTKSGYTVNVVPNGVEAMRRLEVDSFDLVITDLRMPEMSGPELIVQMQKDVTYNKIPIVVLATGAESADLGSLKVDARVSKPFVPKTLLNAVAALIG